MVLLILVGLWCFSAGWCFGRYVHHRAWCSPGQPTDHGYTTSQALKDWKEM